MNTIKNLFPFIASLCVYLLALNSPIYKQINKIYSTDKEIKVIPVEGFKPNEGV
tara:strand:- start:82 stop:243 length:162 start_codon:yes stop_codon:yes gene_type:complete